MALTKISTGMLKQDAASSDLNIDAGTLYIDVSNNRVGVNNTSPDTTLEVSSSTAPTLRISNGGGTSPNPKLEFFRQAGVTATFEYDVANKNIFIKNEFAGTTQFHIGGSERMRIDSNGNVGIGVTPDDSTVRLHIADSSIYGAVIKLDATHTNGKAFKFQSTAASDSMGGGHLVIDDVDAAARRLTLTSDGNVGIGTTTGSPASILHVSGSTGITLGAITGNVWQTTAIKAIDEGANYKGTLAFYTHPYSGSAGSPTERMRIASSGNVGIGTSSPSEMLQIDSADSAIRVNTTNAANNAELQLLYNNNLAHGMLFRYHGNSALGYIDNTYPRESGYSYGDIIFRQSYAGTMTEHMRLTAYDGYLGLFTANPKARLEANLHSGSDSSLMNASSVNDVQLLRAGFGLNAATTSNAGAKWGLRFVGRNDGTYDNGKSAAVYAVSEDALGYNREVGLAFHTSAFDASHAERMRIDADGNVGIGTTSPAMPLHVQANGTNIRMQGVSPDTYGCILDWYDSSGSRRGYIGHVGAGSDMVVSNDEGSMVFNTSASEAMRLTSTGSVGIGESNPDEKIVARIGNYSANVDGGIALQAGVASSYHWKSAFKLKSNGSGVPRTTIDATTGATAGETIEAISIMGTGNVGINNDNPTYKLDVTHTSTPVAKFTGANNAYFDLNDGSVNTRFQNSGGFYLGTTSNHSMYFKTNGGQKMIITTGGNVGINTSDPKQKFTVVGRVNSDSNNDYYGSWFEGNTSASGRSFFAVGSWYSNSTYWENATGANYSHIYTYNPAHNVILQAGSGTNGTTTSSRGKVGIGTTSPGAHLEVHSNANLPIIRARYNDSGYYTDYNSNGITFNGSGQNFDISDNGTSRLYVQSGGNIGLGTTNPPHKLYIESAYNQTIVLADSRSSSDANQRFQSAIVWDAYYDDAARLVFEHNDWSTTYRKLKLQIATSTPGAYNEGLVLQQNGNVGIGTDSPTANLHISGSGNTTAKITAGTNSSASLRLINDAHEWDVNCQTTDTFAIYSHTDATARLAILPSSGYIGIGTTSPDAPLTVHNPSSTSTAFDGTSGLRAHRPNAFGQYGWFEYGYNSDTTYIGSRYTGGGSTSYGQIWFAQDSNGGARQYPLIINAASKVGIGTTSPTSKLTVYGTSSITTVAGSKDIESKRWVSKFISNSANAVATVSMESGDGASQLAGFVFTFTYRTSYGFNSGGGGHGVLMISGRVSNTGTWTFDTSDSTLVGDGPDPTVSGTDNGNNTATITITTPASTHAFGELNLIAWDCTITSPT